MTVLVSPTALSDHRARDFSMFIDGRWEAGASDPIERVAPSHGVVVSRFPTGSRKDAERAISAARKASILGRGRE